MKRIVGILIMGLSGLSSGLAEEPTKDEIRVYTDGGISRFFAPGVQPEIPRDSKIWTNGGVGLVLSGGEDGPVVTSTTQNGPAARANLEAGDVILAVDQKPVSGREFIDILDDIRGPAGSQVVLQVRKKAGKEEAVTLTRVSVEEIMKSLPSPNLGGLGVVIAQPGDPRLVRHVIPSSPAAKAKIETGDRMLKIGDVVLENLDFNLVAGLLSGTIDDEVKLIVEKEGGEKVEVKLKYQDPKEYLNQQERRLLPSQIDLSN